MFFLLFPLSIHIYIFFFLIIVVQISLFMLTVVFIILAFCVVLLAGGAYYYKSRETSANITVMGQNNSAAGNYGTEAENPRAAHDTGSEKKSKGSKGSYSSSHFLSLTPLPDVVGCTSENKDKLIMEDYFACKVAESIPANCRGSDPFGKQKWFLLYSSEVNGKSFQRLAQSLNECGPTVIFVKLKDSSRVIGCFCESDWQTVASREKAAVSRSAAAKRAAREGQNMALGGRPSNQNPVFFGNENCFIFTASRDEECQIYKASSTANSNFMYLFDTHPLEQKVGIGMGGQPDYFGFFLDRWLDSGACSGIRCTTFKNPRLTETESWSIDKVEAYAVSALVVEKLLISGNDLVSESVLNKNPDHEADKAIMELNGMHRFNQNDRTECGQGCS